MSGTLRDLALGSGVRFEERGESRLKGVPDVWRLYAVDATNPYIHAG